MPTSESESILSLSVSKGIKAGCKKDCSTHDVMKEEISSLEKCLHCSGSFAPLKWWGLRCRGCTTVWHTLCFQKLYNCLESSEEEEQMSTNNEYDPEYVPGTETDSDEDDPVNLPASTTTSNEGPECWFLKNFHGTKQKPVVMSITHQSNGSQDSMFDHICEMSDISEKSDGKNHMDKTSDAISTVSEHQNFCFVCKTAQFKIARHFKVHVKEDSDIAMALSLPAGSRKRKELLQELRNRGNFLHNNEVLKNGSGLLKVKRRAKGDYKKYEYCIHCRGMFLRQELWRHMKRCSSKPENGESHGRKRVLGLASVVNSACSSTIQEGVLKILSRMQDDDIAAVVRNDFGLLRFAESLYNKNGHDPSSHNDIRQKVRQLGRFLQTLCKRTQIMTLEEAIKPVHFLKVIDAVKETAGFDKDSNNYKIPSRAPRYCEKITL